MPEQNNAAIDPRHLPRHVAIIMDGNGRWAEQRGLPRTKGHEAGADAVRETLKAARELGLKVLSLYAFSTENWRRSRAEVNALFRLMSHHIRRELDEIAKHGIRVRIMGDIERLPEQARKDLQTCIDRTARNTEMDVCVGLNYGGRAEIVRAARRLASQCAARAMRSEEITEDRFARELYVPEHPEVDLLIRTSGEQRISNFMLWQISYAEIVFLPVLWPDFNGHWMREAIREFQSRRRRFGGRP
ncbi:MAG TPA: polyprenyl diphosphate synthase [Candidatus Hydrogenedentes bacterium]|nr:polyprenyl diphosphate synthase [Candidatus Hydrogenedentota bacterium]